METAGKIEGLTRETVLLGLIGVVDLCVTVLLIQSGAFTEGNPVLGFYLHAGLMAFVGAKALLTLGPLAVLEFLRRRSPRFVLSALRLGIALYVASYAVGAYQLNAVAIAHALQ